MYQDGLISYQALISQLKQCILAHTLWMKSKLSIYHIKEDNGNIASYSQGAQVTRIGIRKKKMWLNLISADFLQMMSNDWF